MPLIKHPPHLQSSSELQHWWTQPTLADTLSIKVIFRDHKGNDIKTVEGNEGDDLLSLAHEYDVDLEGE